MLTELLWKVFLISIGVTVILKLIFRATGVIFLFSISYIVAFTAFIFIIWIGSVTEKIRNRKKKGS